MLALAKVWTVNLAESASHVWEAQPHWWMMRRHWRHIRCEQGYLSRIHHSSAPIQLDARISLAGSGKALKSSWHLRKSERLLIHHTASSFLDFLLEVIHSWSYNPRSLYTAHVRRNFFRYLVYLIWFEAGSACQPKNPEKETLRLVIALKRQGCKAGLNETKNVLITPCCWNFPFPRIGLHFVDPGYILPPTFAICYSFSLPFQVITTTALSKGMQNSAAPNTRALPGEFAIRPVLPASGDYVTHPSPLFRLLGSSWGTWIVLPSNTTANQSRISAAVLPSIGFITVPREYARKLWGRHTWRCGRHWERYLSMTLPCRDA